MQRLASMLTKFDRILGGQKPFWGGKKDENYVRVENTEVAVPNACTEGNRAKMQQPFLPRLFVVYVGDHGPNSWKSFSKARLLVEDKANKK